MYALALWSYHLHKVLVLDDEDVREPRRELVDASPAIDGATMSKLPGVLLHDIRI